MTVIARQPVNDAVKAFLVARTGKPWGDAALPLVPGSGGALQPAAPPYGVLYDLDGMTSGPPLWSPDADVSWIYQVTCVGARADQARWLADKTREAWLARVAGRFAAELVIPGASVMDRWLHEDAGIVADGATVTYVLRLGLALTPAA